MVFSSPSSSSTSVLLSSIFADPSQLFSRLLQSCALAGSISKTRQLHATIVTSGASSDRFITNHLLNAYSKHGHAGTASHLFSAMLRRNTMSYNIMIGAHIQNGDLDAAWLLFDEMPERNVATWSAMVAGAVQFGFDQEGIALFVRMRRSGFLPDEFTLASVMRGCAGIRGLVPGRQIHVHAIQCGLEGDLCVGNSLAHMYMNCGCLTEGERVVEGIPWPSVVSCNTVIAGRVQNRDAEGALSCFHQMKAAGLAPDQITFTSVLSACSELATLGQGQQVHAHLVKTGTDSVVSVRSTLVSMYSKCGCLSDSHKVFAENGGVDYILWSAMIAAYGFHGHGGDAIVLFEQMIRQGTEPNDITFLSLFYACSHSGLKEQCREYFKQMKEVYRLEPWLEHYTCMVDLLGRSGCLEEAENLIISMPMEPDTVIWKTLLSACKIHKNEEMALRMAEHVLRIDPQDSAPYVLLSQIHATSKRWTDVSHVRKHMKDKNVRKEPGISWVELKNKVDQFSMGDTSHPMYVELVGYLKEIVAQMKRQGYVPDTSVILHDMEEEEKENSLLHHSEKLATAFAILKTPYGFPVRIMKNLRVCNDCHTFIKFMSKITCREIVVRDVSRFHHFIEGDCSCRDYW